MDEILVGTLVKWIKCLVVFGRVDQILVREVFEFIQKLFNFSQQNEGLIGKKYYIFVVFNY